MLLTPLKKLVLNLLLRSWCVAGVEDVVIIVSSIFVVAVFEEILSTVNVRILGVVVVERTVAIGVGKVLDEVWSYKI